MRQNIKKSLEEKGWKVGVGEYVATKKVNGLTIFLHYHRNKGYAVLLREGERNLCDPLVASFFSDALKVAESVDQILSFFYDQEVPKPVEKKEKAETATIKRRGRPAKVKIATVS